MKTRLKKRPLAAELMAQGEMTDAQVAERVGVHPVTLAKWKTDPKFAADVEVSRAAILDAVRAEGIANKQNRINGYNEDWQKLQAVIDARATYYTEDDVPGGSTGLIVGKPVMVRVDEVKGAYHTVMEYSVDDAVLARRLAIAKQAAQEMGQWTERRELTGKDGKPIQVQQAPPDLSDLTDEELEVLERITARRTALPDPSRTGEATTQ
jgi:hypothetical protein